MTKVLDALLIMTLCSACTTDEEEPMNEIASEDNSSHTSIMVPDAMDSVVQQDLIEQSLHELPEYVRIQLEKVTSGSRAAGVLLARMTVSEGSSLQPLTKSWKRDMQGILQVARNTKSSIEVLRRSLARLSPHVSKLRPYTRPRQQWVSTLPAWGKRMPKLWVECTEWVADKTGRKQGTPEGCNGVWANGAENWVTVRQYAIQLVKMRVPPMPVHGIPTTWGGIMDLAGFMERNPHMCLLDSPGTQNHFFGLRSDARNKCIPVSKELMKESRQVNAKIVLRDMRRRQEVARAENRSRGDEPAQRSKRGDVFGGSRDSHTVHD